MHRRKMEALNGSLLRFTPQALGDICRITGGVPRLINTLCDSALLKAHAMGTAKITSGIVRQVAEEKSAWSINTPPPQAPPDLAERTDG